MTKLRDPMTPSMTMMTVVGRIGWADASAVTRRSERALRDMGDPDVIACVNLEMAEAMDAAFVAKGGDYRPFLELMQVRADMADALANRSARGRAAKLADAARETGEAIASSVLASAPGADVGSRALARRQCDEAIESMAHLRQDMDEEPGR